ncbi:MAG TPA: hypothetical protein VM345_12625 [Acidimicrobiales bacterium]|jgi:hypothetical protein|nr:hypothetical protein [Acidimicrobiales bacterium]
MAAVTASATLTPAAPAPTWSKAAGITYVAAWVVGLTAFGAGPPSDATAAEVAEYFANHSISTTIQSLLIHGVAAVALFAVLRAVRRTETSSRVSHVAGVVGVALSLTQLALDGWRSLVASGSTTKRLVEVIDRVDGFKMFAFAVMIGASVGALRAAGVIGRRMAIVGVAATVALVVSGVGYAAAVESLRGIAAISLVLLLLWVGYLGVAAGRRTV